MITGLFPTPARRRRADDFARLLEGSRRVAADSELRSLVALTTTMRLAPPAPRSDFSAALRERLVQETTQRSVAARVPVQRAPQVVDARPHRVRQAVATVAAVALVGGAGAAAASTRALPGDSLYGLKRGLESVQLSLAGSELARGRELLEQADARLGEAERLAGASGTVEAQTEVRIAQALEDMDVAVRNGSEVLTDVYRETGDLAALELLDRFVIDQQRRLAALLDRLAVIDPDLRDQADATAALLASLHAEATAATRSTSAVNSTSVVSGAARDPLAPDDGWAVSRLSDNVPQSQADAGGTGSSPSAVDTAQPDPVATADADGGPLGVITDDGTGIEAPAATPVTSGLADTGSTSTTVEPPTPPDPGGTAPTAPTVPDAPNPTALLGDAPCVPVAPLITC